MCKIIKTADLRGSYSSDCYGGADCGSPDGIAYDHPLEATDAELQAIETPFIPQRISIGRSVTIR